MDTGIPRHLRRKYVLGLKGKGFQEHIRKAQIAVTMAQRQVHELIEKLGDPEHYVFQSLYRAAEGLGDAQDYLSDERNL